MSERDFAMAMAMLAEAFGEKGLTPVRIEAYHRGMEGVSLPLLNAAVRHAIQTRQWFPKVAELRADAEVCRRQLIDAHPYERCAACGRAGWVRVESAGQVPKYRQCRCYEHWQARLGEAGVTAAPIKALPPGRDDAA